MKTFLAALIAGLFTLSFAPEAVAQYKAPSEYFPKNKTAPNPGNSPSAPRPNPPATQQPKFKDVVLNSQFYFLADTNRAHPWTKISETSAKNSKSGTVQVISAQTPVQR